MRFKRQPGIRVRPRRTKGLVPPRRKVPKDAPTLREDDPLVAKLKLITSE